MRIQKIGFIGAGNISEALIRGIITSGYLDPGQIVISDTNATRLETVHQTLGTMIAKDNHENAGLAQILFIAVKPHLVSKVVQEIQGDIKTNTFVVSIAAGISLANIGAILGDHKLSCRIMPNLAASVRKSTIGLYAEERLSTQDLAPVFTLLSCTGRVYRVVQENWFAAITALSGSAPAYYVMMADALIQYGISQGLDHELAKEMILNTMEASAAWAQHSKIPLGDLWKKVVTPGGTTEAGINYYQEKGFIDIFVEGLNRATKRAHDIGKQ